MNKILIENMHPWAYEVYTSILDLFNQLIFLLPVVLMFFSIVMLQATEAEMEDLAEIVNFQLNWNHQFHLPVMASLESKDTFFPDQFLQTNLKNCLSRWVELRP